MTKEGVPWCVRSAAGKCACSALLWLPIAINLIVLHAIDGSEITISPRHVTSMRAAHPEKANELVAEQVNCIIGLTDGRFISVIEPCVEVRKMLEETR